MKQKHVSAIEVVKESFSYLLQRLWLMKYFWVTAVGGLLMAHQGMGNYAMDGLISSASVIASILGAALYVGLIRSVLGKERMSWAMVVAQYSKGYFWRMVGTLILLAFLLLIGFAPLMILVYGLLETGGEMTHMTMLVTVAGIFVSLAYLMFIGVIGNIALTHAAGGGHHSIRSAYRLIKSRAVRYFGGLVVASLPMGVLSTLMTHFYAVIHQKAVADGWLMGNLESLSDPLVLVMGLLYLVVVFWYAFFSLFPTIYAAKFYMELTK